MGGTQPPGNPICRRHNSKKKKTRRYNILKIYCTSETERKKIPKPGLGIMKQSKPLLKNGVLIIFWKYI